MQITKMRKKTIESTGMFRYKVWLLAGVLMLSLFACTDPDDDGENKKTTEHNLVNDWVLENMKIYYLWNDYISKNTDKSLYPSDYFETLIYDRKNTDRFSWIQEDFLELMNSLSGINREAGYDFNLLKWSDTSSEVVGYVTYIKPNSPAESANLKRGEFFSAINGIKLTLSNYSLLLSQINAPHTIGIANIQGDAPAVTRTVSLLVEEYTENPILLDTIYRIEDKKIGYLVYNFFANDSGDQSLSYVKELNTIFGNFKAENINELIVDLRYNSGGAMTTANALASMISNHSSSDVFAIEEYNSILTAVLSDSYGSNYNKSYFLDDIEKTKINKLQELNKVYFIVSNRTASASELVINALKPYMNVELIGEKTVGKNVGSITIYEEDPEKQKTNTWGIQPIVVKMANANGFSDYSMGITPDVEIFELELFMNPLGDANEILLNTALNRIFKTSALTRSDNIGVHRDVIGSSIDQTPARKNMYLPFKNNIFR